MGVFVTIFIGIVCLALSGLALFSAAYNDIKEFRIPNITSLVIASSFFVFAAFFLSPIEIAYHVLIASIVFSLTFILYMKNAFGAGDVKLLSALSLWASATMIMPFLFAVSLFGGVFAILVLVSQKRLHTQTHNKNNDKKENTLIAWIKTRQEIPYGVAIAFGGVLVLHDRLNFLLS